MSTNEDLGDLDDGAEDRSEFRMRSITLLILLLFGLQNADAQFEAGLAGSLISQNADLDQLIEQMIPEVTKLLPSDSSRAELEKEQSKWLKIRKKQCRKEARSFPREQRAVREQQCRYDMGVRRLEELLVRYDELSPK